MNSIIINIKSITFYDNIEKRGIIIWQKEDLRA